MRKLRKGVQILILVRRRDGVTSFQGKQAWSPAIRSHTRTKTDATADFDAIIIGAGVSGLYQLYKLRELGLKVRVFETGTNVGGTWYWNRYPGARFDSESWTYGYSFSEELLQEWNWAEHFASQPETERYLNYVADKFDLRRDIQCKSRVTSAQYREETRTWDVTLEDGRRYCTRFLITAIGVLSAPTMPRIAGVERSRVSRATRRTGPRNR